MVVSCVTPTGGLARIPGMCPDWGSNQRPFGLQAGAQSTAPHQPGQESPLKGPTMDLGLTQTHSFSALALGQQLEGHQWHVERN